MMRYVQAFFTALHMTLRGERPPQSPYTPLITWIRQAEALLSAVYATAESHGISKAALEELRLRIDSRSISAETILGTVRHHIRQEYPLLLRASTQHAVTAIYASNLNDRYYVSRLQEAFQTSAMQQAVARLSAHLDAIPPSNFTENS
jgi:hypothetical protein